MQDKTINISLPLTAVNIVLNALAQRPFAEVAGVIQEIKSQAEAQVAQAAAAEAKESDPEK